MTRKDDESANPDIGQTRPRGENQAPPPEVTNFAHPGKSGRNITVPGAGVLKSGDDAGPIENIPGLSDAPHPGMSDPSAPVSAPGATIPESYAGMSGPNDSGTPQGASETLAPEIHDPNFSAASPGQQRAPGK
jgi:hypothetical protein